MTLFSELREGMLISWGTLRANKMRSALTTLGIIIGVVTVTLMGTAIEGLQQAFLNSISTLGADVFYVDRFAWFNRSQEDWMRNQKRQRITLPQIRALERQMTLAQAVVPFTDTGAPIKYKNRSSARIFLLGTTDQYLNVSRVVVEHGRFMSREESDGGRPVCVIGTQVATNLFINETPLG